MVRVEASFYNLHVKKCNFWKHAKVKFGAKIPTNSKLLKGMSRDEYLFWRRIIKIGTFCHCADDFYIFCFLVDEKIKLKVLKLLWNYLLILKIHPVTCFKEPIAAILILKMLTGKPPLLLLNHTGSHLWQVNSCTFSVKPREVDTRKHRQITEKEILRRISVSIFKNL